MGAILNRMPAGFPGDVSRKTEATIEAGFMAATVPYGAPVTLDDDGKLAPLADGDTVYGFMVRPYPTQMTAAEAGSIQDVMRRGYMTITLAQGTAVKGGQVYARHTADAGKAVGDIEAAADAGKNVAVPGCIFMGEADGSGNVEISFNL